jgi:hypothetical protein
MTRNMQSEHSSGKHQKQARDPDQNREPTRASSRLHIWSCGNRRIVAGLQYRGLISN